MMDQLLSRAEQLRPGLQETFSKLITRNNVQGAVLEVDRYWFEMFLYDWLGFHPYDDYHRRSERWLWLRTLHTPQTWNFDYRPPLWDSHQKTMGYQEGSGPLVIRIILNATEESVEGQLPRSFEGHPIIYETRPQLEAVGLIERLRQAVSDVFSRPEFGTRQGKHPAAVSVGRSGNAPTAGTLGGILHNTVTSKRYLVSCAHVLGEQAGTAVYSPGPYENRGMNQVGEVKFAELPDVRPGQACNLLAIPTAGRLDLAVAEVLPDVQLPGVTSSGTNFSTVRLAMSMTPFQPVSFTGKVSGTVAAYLGGCTIWHSINFPDGPRCFGGLFEVVAPSGHPVPLARRGDSGAWVVDNALSAPSWNGMLISAVPNGDRAYCCFAQHILEACEPQFPGGLSFVL